MPQVNTLVRRGFGSGGDHPRAYESWRFAAVMALLVMVACSQEPQWLSGPMSPAIEDSSSRPSWSIPNTSRPPWLSEPSDNPERYHVPDDGFGDNLARA
jgi:hypothetical protein